MINVRPKVSQSYFCFSNFLRKKGVEMREMRETEVIGQVRDHNDFSQQHHAWQQGL